MQAGVYALNAAGLPAIDLAAQLGSIADPKQQAIGYGLGLVAHGAIGIAWALFYAYFFWGRLRWPRPLQGLVFAIIPAALAIAIVYPQLRLMQLNADVATVKWSDFPHLSVGEIVAIVLIHALYGLTLGALYTHPVGYRLGHKPPYPHAPKPIERTPSCLPSECWTVDQSRSTCRIGGSTNAHHKPPNAATAAAR